MAPVTSEDASILYDLHACISIDLDACIRNSPLNLNRLVFLTSCLHPYNYR